MSSSQRSRALAVGCAALLAIAALASPATADQVFHSEHLNLMPVGPAPLRSGFVEDIKAEGPQIYAREIFVLNGALPDAAYRVTRDFFFQSPHCDGQFVFHDDVARLTTNASGNAQADLVIRPEEIAGFEGVHGVAWTVRDAAGAVVYRTACTAVTLD